MCTKTPPATGKLLVWYDRHSKPLVHNCDASRIIHKHVCQAEWAHLQFALQHCGSCIVSPLSVTVQGSLDLVILDFWVHHIGQRVSNMSGAGKECLKLMQHVVGQFL